MMAANGSLQGEQFYKQVIRLLMNYISVKLNYKVATQSKAVLASILLENGISRHTADKAIALIDYCEQVCYAQKRDFSNREYINDLFCEVVCELHNDFSRSVKCSRLK